MLRVGLCVAMLACTTNGVPVDDDVADMGRIELPDPREVGEHSVEELMAARRSVRSFTDEPLTHEQMGQLLWSGQGITEPAHGFRTAPSAGATYPMTLYLVSAEGAYRYDPEDHEMIPVRAGDRRMDLRRVALDQASISEAPVSIVAVADYARTTGRYGDRGVRFVHIEAGHIAQNIHLQAVAEGLGSVPIGAFDDDGVLEVLGLSDDLTPLYIIPVGHAAR